MKQKSKILLYDIETSPIVSYTWGLFEQNTIDVKEEWYMLSFSYKWLGDKQTHVVSLPDFELYKKEPKNDLMLIKKLWELFDEAEVVIGHNSNSFDNRKSNSRFITHGLTPPSPYKTIDTKLVAKRYFKFDSNSLNNLGKYLGVGRKLETGGFDLWLGCMAGDTKSWKTMCKYNKQDVVLLEKVYLKLRGWMVNHHRTNDKPITEVCPNCGGNNLQRRGFIKNLTNTKQRLHCQGCGAWSSTKI